MAGKSLLPCEVKIVYDLNEYQNNWDCICVISDVPSELSDYFAACRAADNYFDKDVSCFKTPKYRVVYSPIGALDDYDDVRVYERAAGLAIARAIKAGSKKPILVVPSSNIGGKYTYLSLSTLLGTFYELYVPIQLREDVPDKKEQIEVLGVYMEDSRHLLKIMEEAINYEKALFVARDIGGGDPERMAPPRVEEYIKSVFGSSKSIKIEVIKDPAVFERDYPLFQAVNRAAGSVTRHTGRIIFLEYRPPSDIKKTLMFVGKGVTYDTGGADVKAGGVMATMSRDKCGAAAVAGFMKLVDIVKPKDIHVISALCMVRNSIGEECYVSDEVITSRAGVRVRIGNTDAEGRMCMADALCQMKERAINSPDPHLFTIATLTGHAYLSVGVGYSIVMDNGPAKLHGHDYKLKQMGDRIGNPFEISTIYREDFKAHTGVCLGEDVIQSNNLPSSRTNRGHQTPAAFMMLSTGLDKHGSRSNKPLKYSHLDIAGSAGEFPLPATGAPILALAKLHLNI